MIAARVLLNAAIRPWARISVVEIHLTFIDLFFDFAPALDDFGREPYMRLLAGESLQVATWPSSISSSARFNAHPALVQ
jgi:hypothetical protein